MAELSGMDAFAHLGSELRTALSEQGFSTPTEPQREAIPPLADGKNALVLAPTGTGKTETAMLPVFDAIVDPRDARRPASLGHLRALHHASPGAQPRHDGPIEWWGDRLGGVEVAVRHGDTTRPMREQAGRRPAGRADHDTGEPPSDLDGLEDAGRPKTSRTS